MCSLTMVTRLPSNSKCFPLTISTFLRVQERLADVERHGDGAGDPARNRARQEVNVGVIEALGVQRPLTHGVRSHNGRLKFQFMVCNKVCVTCIHIFWI